MNKATEVDMRFALPGDLADWIDEYKVRSGLPTRKQALVHVLRIAQQRDRDRHRKKQERSAHKP